MNQLARKALRLEYWIGMNVLKNTEFQCLDYKEAFEKAMPGDFIFCDPPYKHSQGILYGAQSFKLAELFDNIKTAKDAGNLRRHEYRRI